MTATEGSGELAQSNRLWSYLLSSERLEPIWVQNSEDEGQEQGFAR